MTETIKNRIDLKLILLFIPVAYGSYLFHESGHWIAGEILGNDMSYSLNYVWPKSGQYIGSGHDLYVSMGGPVFTILLSLLFLLVIEKYKTIYAYPVVFFQFYLRFFSIVFGGFSKQDEASISVLAGIGTYTVAIVVLLILLLMVWRASHILRVSLKENGYFVTIGTVCMLMVIGTYEFILKH